MTAGLKELMTCPGVTNRSKWENHTCAATEITWGVLFTHSTLFTLANHSTSDLKSLIHTSIYSYHLHISGRRHTYFIHCRSFIHFTDTPYTHSSLFHLVFITHQSTRHLYFCSVLSKRNRDHSIFILPFFHHDCWCTFCYC